MPGGVCRTGSGAISPDRTGGSRTIYGESVAVDISGILDAHGGLDLWRSLSAVEVEVSIRGLLFTTKRIAPLRHARLTVNTRTPRTVLHDFPEPGRHAVLDGADRVEIRDSGGDVLASRSDPRTALRHWRRSLSWDALDFTYFCGYAMWNYVNLPFLLVEPGVTVEAVAADHDPGTTRLRARFPARLPTHSPTQEFWFDSSGLLRRHDYTAEVVGRWAKAVHLCEKYREFGGLRMPTRRRVHPRGPGGAPLRSVTLVAIDVHDAQPG